MTLKFALCAVALGACSINHPLDPGAGDSAGSGTATLVVQGSAAATPLIPAASDATDFTTSFDVRLTLAGQDVTTGTVTMTSSAGKTALVFTTANATGSWQGTGSGYDEVYQLDVASGSDTITGVRVDGPDIHTFTAPTAGASVDATMPMTVTWNRSDAADVATIRVGDGGGANDVTITDSGTYAIAAGSLKSNKQQAETNTIRLTRENHVAPAGAAAGSELVVSIENTVEVVALPNPAAAN